MKTIGYLQLSSHYKSLRCSRWPLQWPYSSQFGFASCFDSTPSLPGWKGMAFRELVDLYERVWNHRTLLDMGRNFGQGFVLLRPDEHPLFKSIGSVGISQVAESGVGLCFGGLLSDGSLVVASQYASVCRDEWTRHAWSHVTSSGAYHNVSQNLRHLEWKEIIGEWKMRYWKDPLRSYFSLEYFITQPIILPPLKDVGLFLRYLSHSHLPCCFSYALRDLLAD